VSAVTEDIRAVLRRKFRGAMLRRRLPEARDALAGLAELDPLSSWTRGFELELLIAEGRLDEARPLADQLVDQFPASAGIRFHAGMAAYRSRDYERARAELAESLRLHPRWRTERWLGKALTQAGRFHEAEPLITRLCADHPECLGDLAWLHERMGDPIRALATVEELLRRRPDDAFALQHRARLRAARLPADDVIDEVATLEDLGEEVPEALVARQLEVLLAKGQTGEARALVDRRLASMSPSQAAGLGWVAHRLMASDLAVELFLVALPARRSYVRMLNALQKHAERAGMLERVAQAFERDAVHDKRLFGRARKLRGKIGPR
jgi:tetratricopeptide (TPR) repeat protein